MRKKSHISLANHMLTDLKEETLVSHNHMFQFGSLLPDLVPTFLTKKHRVDTTFDILEKKLRKVVDNYDGREKLSRGRCKDLGVVNHYIADYFTLPHNQKFTGSLKDHMNYEEVLKYSMRDYVSQANIANQPLIRMAMTSVDDICKFIKSCHEEYIEMTMNGQDIDCMHSVEVCRQVMEAVVALLHQKEYQHVAMA
ncbi:MAG: zinc dependent phospholipase C family protein [Lachnospiraceae bacterium]|nr:zinc dependent phospholipase C family protein [Lachnospiraceae bacterium]